MTLVTLTKEEFQSHADSVETRSFMQTAEMASLLEKRGNKVQYLGWKENNQILVSAILYSMPMTGGLHMEINSGPIYSDPSKLQAFYQALQTYAKENGALELIVKPYNTYQTFDSNGQPISEENPQLIQDLTAIGYSHDGLTTGYPGGEPDWHYVKDLTGISEKDLIKSFSKKGKPLVKKAGTFGIQLKKLTREELHIFKDITASTSDRREYSDKSLDYYEQFYDAFGDQAEFIVATLNFQDYLQNLEKDRNLLQNQIQQFQAEHPNGQASAKFNRQMKELNNQLSTFEQRITEANELLKTYGTEDQILAGSLFIYTPQESTYLFSGSYTEFNKFYAPAVLQERVMLESIKRGIPHYNFLGIMGIFDGSDGVLRFKQNFNGYIVRKMGTFRYYPNPVKYRIIQLLKKVFRRN